MFPTQTIPSSAPPDFQRPPAPPKTNEQILKIHKSHTFSSILSTTTQIYCNILNNPSSHFAKFATKQPPFYSKILRVKVDEGSVSERPPIDSRPDPNSERGWGHFHDRRDFLWLKTLEKRFSNRNLFVMEIRETSKLA